MLLPRSRRDRARAGHRRGHVSRQPRAAHRQPREARRRREPAARPEQRPGCGPHGLRARPPHRLRPIDDARAGLRGACGAHRGPGGAGARRDADASRPRRRATLKGCGSSAGTSCSRIRNADADAARARPACELVVVQDLFLNETAREFGTVFLPACSSFEKDGTFMNSERRIQRVRSGRSSRSATSKPDWEIMCLVAQRHGT